MVLEVGLTPRGGNAGGQQPLDIVDDGAKLQATGKFASVAALTAGALDQISDVEVESISQYRRHRDVQG
jgi:hypothetical protein